MAIFFNQATLSYSGGVVNSNITTGEIVEILTLTKTAVVDTYTQGSEITYVINLQNTGTTPLTNLTLSDDLGAYPFGMGTVVPLDYVAGSLKYFIGGVLQPTPTITGTTPALSLTGLSVPAGDVATVVYTVRTNLFAPPILEGSVTNTVTVSGGGLSPITATATVTAQEDPLLSICKSLNPTVVPENGTLTYTFLITNRGNTEAVATDNVVITDTFDPALSDITVTYNGAPWTSPTNYTYNEATGVFTTVAGQITVPPATYTQDPVSGAWSVTPGTATLTVTGTV